MKKTINKKKQFRLYDIYRCAATGLTSNINGILEYSVTDDARVIFIMFEDVTGQLKHGIAERFKANTEDELKEVVTEVNKRLGNCRRPGRRARRLK